MKSMHELKNMLCEELDQIARRGTINAGDLETVHKLTAAIKNIDTIEAMENDDYSRAGWDASDSYGRYSRGGDSYASRRGMHYVRGHYSHADNEREMLTGRIEEMLDDSNLSLDEKSTLKRAMNIIRR